MDMSGRSVAPASAQAYMDYQRQRQMTLGDLLLENRIVFLQGEIYDGNANELVMKLLYLQSENRRKDIHFYINSPGGSVTATMAIYDTMQMLTCSVSTYCVGLAAQRRRDPARRWRRGKTLCPAPLEGHDSPTVRGCGWSGQRHRNSSRANHQDS